MKAATTPCGPTSPTSTAAERVAIFYKAAFYDRSAHMNLRACVVRGQARRIRRPLVITGEWATREAVLAAMRERRGGLLKQAAEWRVYAADEAGRDARNRARCAEHAAEDEATAAKYEAAVARLEAEGELR